MNWDQINDWFDAFYDATVGKKPVRGRIFSGGKIEIWDRDNVAVVLTGPMPRGSTDESRAADFIKNVFDEDHQEISAEMNYARFQKVLSGEQPLTDEDFIWPDE
jgi:hypothetical protein